MILAAIPLILLAPWTPAVPQGGSLSARSTPSNPVGPAAPALVLGEVDESEVFQDEFIDPGLFWKPICSDLEEPPAEDLNRIAASSGVEWARAVQPAPGASQSRLGSFQVDFMYVPGDLTIAQITALAEVKTYIESFFSDPITITIAFAFAPLGANILGATTSGIHGSNYNHVRNQLYLDRGDDVILSYLPLKLYGLCPLLPNLRVYTALSSEYRCRKKGIYYTYANMKAFGDTPPSSPDAMILLNSIFTFDYDPSNGVIGRSFQDVLIHEVGHVMGFVSGGDHPELPGAFFVLDAFRFRDSTSMNPVNSQQFKHFPRSITLNVPEHTDLISAEYPMEDGDPSQYEHFKQHIQPNPRIGIMEPALPANTTNWPNYYTNADLDVLDVIGFDR